MKIDKNILAKYFKGECSEEEAAFVDAYLQQETTPEMDAYLATTWEAAQAPVIPTPVATPVKTVKLHRVWFGAAAAILALVSVCAWLWQSKRTMPEHALALQWDTIYNASRNIRLVSMPDGSKVWLSAHAAVAYTANYNDTTRELWLQGEAYFDVAQQAGKPFRVHTHDLVTTALGTAFNIATTNRADSSIAVSLLSGKVSVSADGFSHILQPGEMLLYKKGVLPASITRFNAAEILDWKNGKLIFDNTTLEDAFAKLQSRYKQNIVLEDNNLAKKKVSGSFTSNMTLEQILATLQYVHGFSYKLAGDTYVVDRP
ncbi:DUF4974 domain-containing protein [Chitinophaga agrisoli]|uniref:DUF4974 domain-containing protein n=1 Tax=Chitinophaga agrisoli TaxID=2607653 RepID=A0A5B2VTJ8_9BACT|nr:FecR domain-containing protein [Chitinophaga agrisoli]KAA2241652.1 DUF4974 domain-containing protein [Chitinophaga agrisoli]